MHTSIQSFIADGLTTSDKKIFPQNSEALSPEFLENFEEMFAPSFTIISVAVFSFSLRYCVTHFERLIIFTFLEEDLLRKK